ncbi:SLC13 family permease [Botrimarina hoheduenensis]|uniref:Sodium-dependent dicarboxylate transporter SdcS n=1 Tax=Botrimarina hoheduenensis TaxID=2528000 RepID=A0A5C5WE58_9BACT|nr:DASS family sodium-coupled anion symporter [Botrimarina hoheduenensis]TWT48433.1 Sodium-dependent dicarboxylate transporter SdcS [Botrimarina hoheduenensis]
MMFHGSRNEARRLLGLFEFSQAKTLVATAGCLALAAVIALVPVYEGLSEAGHRALFVLIFCAGMWVTEAIPAFATSLLGIGLLIALLGRPDGVFATGPKDWEMFLAPWGSPLIWLFFGGFCLAESAAKTGLDRWLATRALSFFGVKPAWVLLGVMLVTAVLSMFVSNTATATLVLAMMTPIFAARMASDRVSKAIALGVGFAANIGGMGTVIGTPPNAIAAGLLSSTAAPINFLEWMMIGLPPAAALLAIAWGYLVIFYLGDSAFSEKHPIVFESVSGGKPIPALRQLIVVGTFVVTVGLWVTSPLHGLPTTLISLVPITSLTGCGILSGNDIRKLPWDILLLITGGLSLGVAMEKTGLATWAVSQLPLEGLVPLALAIGFGYVAVVMSNLMSNTATANLVVPISIAVLTATAGSDVRLAAAVALSASTAMCLPISTPPNAIVYGSGHVTTRDLIGGGLLVGLLGPVIVCLWVYLALGWL